MIEELEKELQAKYDLMVLDANRKAEEISAKNRENAEKKAFQQKMKTESKKVTSSYAEDNNIL